MKNLKSVFLLTSMLAIMFAFVSWSSGDDNPTPQSRNIKYGITGNYSGRSAVAYSDEGGNSQTMHVNSFSWSKSLVVGSSVQLLQ